MFNKIHITYMVVSALISALVIFIVSRFGKKGNIRAIKFFALITVLIHYSSLWVDYFTNGEVLVSPEMLLPIHPCNICMWLLIWASFTMEKEGRIFTVLREFVFWGGCVCGFIGILLNTNFDINPTLKDYYVLKGLLSHSTMIVGSLIMLTGGFIKVRVSNFLSVASGLLLFFVTGMTINSLYEYFELPPCNSMYLLKNPFDNLPWLTTPVIGVVGVLVCFVLSGTYQIISSIKKRNGISLANEAADVEMAENVN